MFLHLSFYPNQTQFAVIAAAAWIEARCFFINFNLNFTLTTYTRDKQRNINFMLVLFFMHCLA